MKLTDKQLKHLRSLAHSLKPIVTIGSAGISNSVNKELDKTLEHHELIKVKVRTGDRDARDTVIAQMVTASGAQLVTRIGNIATLYRQKKKNPKISLPKL